jgi:hypothetical protein
MRSSFLIAIGRFVGKRIMRVLGGLVATLLAFATPLSGCYTTNPEKHLLGLVALRTEGLRIHVLERGVRATHCKTAFHASGDLGGAVEDAVSQVEGADVLVNASVYAHQTGSGVCVEVVGDAAVLY